MPIHMLHASTSLLHSWYYVVVALLAWDDGCGVCVQVLTLAHAIEVKDTFRHVTLHTVHGY